MIQSVVVPAPLSSSPDVRGVLVGYEELVQGHRGVGPHEDGPNTRHVLPGRPRDIRHRHA